MLKSPVFEVTVVGSHTLVLPEEIVQPFIDAKQKRVKATAQFEGNSIEFHGAIQKYHGRYQMMFGKSRQKELGVLPQDHFKLQFFEDRSKYGVEMPEELEAVLESDLEAKAIFDSFTDGKKRGIIYMVKSYKNSQTRIDKSLLIMENLKRGIRHNPHLLKRL